MQVESTQSIAADGVIYNSVQCSECRKEVARVFVKLPQDDAGVCGDFAFLLTAVRSYMLGSNLVKAPNVAAVAAETAASPAPEPEPEPEPEPTSSESEQDQFGDGDEARKETPSVSLEELAKTLTGVQTITLAFDKRFDAVRRRLEKLEAAVFLDTSDSGRPTKRPRKSSKARA